MQTSIYIAKIIGPCCVVVGLGLLFNRKFYLEMMQNFCKNKAFFYFGGLISLVIGLLIVLSHNIWQANWAIIITIFGWGGIVKGIWLIVFPNSIEKFTLNYIKSKALVFHSALFFTAGVILTFFGYFAA